MKTDSIIKIRVPNLPEIFKLISRQNFYFVFAHSDFPVHRKPQNFLSFSDQKKESFNGIIKKNAKQSIILKFPFFLLSHHLKIRQNFCQDGLSVSLSFV
jgi:hypothetical protein